MPLTFFKRENKDIWLALAKSKTGHQNVIQLSSLAHKVEDDLQKNGASFFQEIQERNGLLKSQLEDGLAELVARGLVTSDSFSGLRTLLGRNKRKNRTWSLKKGRENSISEVEYAGRWSLQDDMRENYQRNEAKNRLNKKIHILDERQLERLIYISQTLGCNCALIIRKREFGTTLERASNSAQKDGASGHIERRAFHRRVKRRAIFST